MKLRILALLTLFTACARAQQPNILWLVSEDHGPQMGCYGDKFATTPNVDALAAKGMIFRRCWSNAPVCAPARTVLITGLHGTSTGGEHMRSMVPAPAGKKSYPELMRDAGYYCTNNSKEDYNVTVPKDAWNESSNKAHWKNRPEGKPFLAVFNSGRSHESQIRKRPHKALHDPAKVRVPAYHPDTPEVRQDWAQYYDQVSAADAEAGERLAELHAAGLTEDTVVFYYGDHGSGMPRSKRWPYNSGLHVPLVVFIPEKWKALRPADYKPGGASERLVSFVDFAPTLLSLAGVKPPDWMQGRAFLGSHIAEPPQYLHGFRGRMDERVDLVRSVTDGRYVYVRNYMPHLIYGQHINYMFQTPTTRVWKAMFDAGKLDAAQSAFWKPKPAEELYDLQNDPDEVKNLATDPAHAGTKARLRKAQQEHAAAVRDTGFIPEGERLARCAGAAPYDYARDGDKYPFARVFAAAEAATIPADGDLPSLQKTLTDSDSAVRWWSALGILIRGESAVRESAIALARAMEDASPAVQVVAAQALAQYGGPDAEKKAVPFLVARADWAKNGVFTSLAALAALDAIGPKAKPFAAEIGALPEKGPAPHARFGEYPPRLLEGLRETLK